MRSTFSLFALAVVVMLVAAPLSALASDAPQAAAQQAAPQQAAPQPPAERKFTKQTGAFLNVIKADKVADFEAFIKKLHQALAATDKENRKSQAAGWRVFKLTSNDAQGNSIYLFLIDPTVDVDYTITRIMVDVFSAEEARAVYETIKDAWVTQNMWDLELIANFGAAPAAGAPVEITSPISK
jgi:hypothetical protein